MKTIVLLLGLCLCTTSFAGPRCFVPNYNDGTVSVYDQAYLSDPFLGVERDTFLGDSYFTRIQVGASPTKVAVALDGRWAFSANSGSSTVSWFSAQMVHDPAVGGLNYPVYHRNIPVGSQPRDLCVGRNPSNGTLRLFVANSQSSYLTAIDPAESVLGVKTYATANISVTGASGAPAYPRALHGPRASSPDTSGWYPFVSDVYVATWNTNGATVNKISSSGTSTPFATLPITPSRRSPRSLSVSQDGKQIWVVSAAYEGGQEVDAGYVDVVQASNGTLLYSSGRIPLVGGAGVTLNGRVALDSRSNKAYVALSTISMGRVYVFTISDTGGIAYSHYVTVGSGARGLDVAPDDSTVWVANPGDNTLSVLDTTTDTVAHTVYPSSGFGIQPYSVTFAAEDLRTFDEDAYGGPGGAPWPMFAGGAHRIGVARSPLLERTGPNANITNPGSTASPAWAATVPNIPYLLFQGYKDIYVNASPIVADDSVILATYTGTGTGSVYSYAATGNGAGQPSLRWQARGILSTALADDFLATPVAMDNSSSGGGGAYVVCVSVDGDVYAIANSTYHTSYGPGGVTLYPGDIMWHKKITSSVAGQTPHVISSPFRY